MSQIWQWLENYQQSLWNASVAHQQMMIMYQLSVTHPQESMRLSLLKQSRAVADALGEQCFSLFLAHWMTEHYLWKSRDYSAALDNALEAVLQYRHIKNTACPLADRLYINLVEVYTEIDPGGYRKEIEDSLTHVENHIDIDYESRCMMAFRRGLLHARLHEFEDANAQAAHCLQIAEGAFAAAYYFSIAYFVQAVVGFKQDDMTTLQRIATTGANRSRKGVHVVYLPELLMFAALAALKNGQENVAKRQYHDATRHADYDPTALSFAWYDAHSAWFAQQNRFVEAIKVRETQYERIQKQGRVLDEVELWLEMIQLKKQANLSPDETITAARTAITKLKNPARHEALLAEIIAEN